MSTSVTLQSLTKRFPPVRGTKAGASSAAVDSVSLRIEPGELFFLLGPSGCGKTTLLRMIAGFIRPTAGTITFGDPPTSRDVTQIPPNKRNTGMVFQSYALWPHMTVQANVAFGLSVRRVAPQEMNRRVAEALEMVQMGEYAGRKPNQLSGGQQQRVALARALVVRPDVLLLDEPLSNLDAKLRIELRSEIRRICKQAPAEGAGDGRRSMTTVYVTHDQKEALGMAERIAVMRQGSVAQIGTPSELYRNPSTPFVAEFMGETNFLDGAVVGKDQNTEFVRVQTMDGEIKALPVGSEITPGTQVRCSIRPESIRIRPANSADHFVGNMLEGELVEITYLGDVQQLRVRLLDGQSIKAVELHPARNALLQGTRVTVLIPNSDVVAFRSQQS